MLCVCRMEEKVRTLLQNQGVLEPTAVDTVDIMKAYKVKHRKKVFWKRKFSGKKMGNI